MRAGSGSTADAPRGALKPSERAIAFIAMPRFPEKARPFARKPPVPSAARALNGGRKSGGLRSEQASLGQAREGVIGDHQMIVYGNAEDLSGLGQLARHADVLTAGLGIARWVRMRHDESGGVGLDGEAEDGPRLDDRCGQAADARHGERGYDIGRVERQHDEFFPVAPVEILFQDDGHVFGAAHLEPGRVGELLFTDERRAAFREPVKEVQLVALACFWFVPGHRGGPVSIHSRA